MCDLALVVCMYACTRVCAYVSMHVRVCVCVCVCVYLHLCARARAWDHEHFCGCDMRVCTCACGMREMYEMCVNVTMYTSMCLSVNACMHACKRHAQE
jgi:hypothetical protein